MNFFGFAKEAAIGFLTDGCLVFFLPETALLILGCPVNKQACHGGRPALVYFLFGSLFFQHVMSIHAGGHSWFPAVFFIVVRHIPTAPFQQDVYIIVCYVYNIVCFFIKNIRIPRFNAE